MWDEFREGGQFQVLAVDVWNGTPSGVQSFITATGVTFPVLRSGGYLQRAEYYGLDRDNYVVIDANGIVRYTSASEPSGTYGRFNGTNVRAAIRAHWPLPVAGNTWSGVKGLYR